MKIALASAIFSAVFLSSCATSQIGAFFTAPHPEVTGVYASYLSWRDILQIAALARTYPEIRKPIYSIQVIGRNFAEVESGQTPKKVGDKYTTFQVRRADGQWYMLKDSISDQEWRRIIVM